MTVERARPLLRAVRREPLLLDDRAVVERLQTRTALPPDTARWARAWLVCWFAALVADERFGRDDPWDIALPLDAVALPKGGGDVERQREVVAALVAAGIAAVSEERQGRGRRVQHVARLSADLFVEHAAALSIDWTAVVAACGAEPAALLTMRALAELVVPPDAPSAVPRRDLMARTGYQQKQVRVAVRRLVASDLLVADGDVGTTARYRFTPRALGRRWVEPIALPSAPAADVALEAAPTPAPPLARATAASAAAAPDPRAGDGVRLVIGGATVTIAAGASFEIGAGVAARLELGPDGQPRLVIGS